MKKVIYVVDNEGEFIEMIDDNVREPVIGDVVQFEDGRVVHIRKACLINETDSSGKRRSTWGFVCAQMCPPRSAFQTASIS